MTITLDYIIVFIIVYGMLNVAQYKGQIFKVPQMSGWLLIVSGNELVDELCSAPEDVLSMEAAMADVSI